MMQSLKWRTAAVVAATLLGVVFLLPTLMGPDSGLPAAFAKKKLNLGLDLQGGMHLMLEVEAEKAVENALARVAGDLKETLREKGVRTRGLEVKGNELQVLVHDASAADQLTAMAAKVTSGAASGELAPPGSDSGFQLQVASFKDQKDADHLVEELRRRGHSAFRQAAYVNGRVLWHRVRIGPFETKYEATQYKKKFEASERISPFVVDPEQVRRAEELRDAKAAARERRAQGGGD